MYIYDTVDTDESSGRGWGGGGGGALPDGKYYKSNSHTHTLPTHRYHWKSILLPFLSNKERKCKPSLPCLKIHLKDTSSYYSSSLCAESSAHTIVWGGKRRKKNPVSLLSSVEWGFFLLMHTVLFLFLFFFSFFEDEFHSGVKNQSLRNVTPYKMILDIKVLLAM